MLKIRRLSRTARTVIGVTFVASLLTAGFMIATTNAAVGKAVAHIPAVTKDVVGTGTFNCSSGYGEVGYSPTTGSSEPSAPMMISVWLVGTKCAPVAGTVATPLPTDVALSFSIEEPYSTSTGPQLPITTTCPLGGQFPGNANLAYTSKAYPFGAPKDKLLPPGATQEPRGKPFVDPSVAMSAILLTGGATWTITGTGAANWFGSYAPGANFVASFHPYWLNGSGVGNCTTGITSGWLDDVTIDGI